MSELMIDSFVCDNDSTSFPIALFHSDDRSTPYHMTFITCHVFAILVFAVSTMTGNLSQVDKLWSILPCVYTWMCVVDSRTRLMAILSSFWSVRLTYNFYRRGGYTWPKFWLGDEDYRWNVIRRGTLGGVWTILANRWALMVFNIVFISLIQNWLLLWIAAPSLVAWTAAMKALHCTNQYQDEMTSLNMLDGIASILFMAALVIETIADNQQYTFQTKKRTQHQPKEKFCQNGLFSIVRKPNYAAEQFLWFSFYLFSVAASSTTWNWSGYGFLSLLLLFQGSGWLTEQITVGKYPEYTQYQRSVPLYIPSILSLLACKKPKASKRS